MGKGSKATLASIALFTMVGSRSIYHAYCVYHVVGFDGLKYNGIFWLLAFFALFSFVITGTLASFFYENNLRESP